MNLLKRFFHWFGGWLQKVKEIRIYSYHWDEADDAEFEYHI